ncbi:helix-turn-helix domain-containing protein [Sphingomonas sp. DBB INV C78]|uniref:helix-turn-helix domain-containing protein n=1 Tax=Sphingomonas sp. DBB INV C78 TaxID=3349434 RepID=UPI0036D33DE0
MDGKPMHPSPLTKLGSKEVVEMDPVTVRIPEACRLTGIGRSKLYELIQAGEIPIVKIGSMTLVPVESLRALIDRHQQ